MDKYIKILIEQHMLLYYVVIVAIFILCIIIYYKARKILGRVDNKIPVKCEIIISILISFLSLVLSFICSDHFKDLFVLNMILWSLNIFSGLIIGMYSVNRQVKDNIRLLEKEVKSIQLYISNNPVFKSKDSHKQLVDNLPNVPATRWVINFFEETFSQTKNKGLITIDQTMIEYTRRLNGIVQDTTKSIIGTYTTRPIRTYENREDEAIKKYNHSLTQKKGLSITRIVVLSQNDIDAIHDDFANKQCMVGDEAFNEIDWFMKKWCDGFTVLWTSNEIFSEFFSQKERSQLRELVFFAGNKTADFAIFDGNLYATWRKYDTAEMEFTHEYGNMMLNWNNQIKDLYDVLTAINSSQDFAFDSFQKLYNHITKCKRSKK